MRNYMSEKYQKFIRSAKWQKIRLRALDNRGHKCEKCGSLKKLHVHHLNYKGFGGNEQDNDLQILCRSCHMRVHRYKYGTKELKNSKKRKKKEISQAVIENYRVNLLIVNEYLKNNKESNYNIAKEISNILGDNIKLEFKDGRPRKNKATKYVNKIKRSCGSCVQLP